MRRAAALIVLAVVSALWALAVVHTVASLLPASERRVDVIDLEPTTTTTTTSAPPETASSTPPPAGSPPPPDDGDDDDDDEEGDDG
jgi:hypothetical protein